jgi:UPF0755 protein
MRALKAAAVSAVAAAIVALLAVLWYVYAERSLPLRATDVTIPPGGVTQVGAFLRSRGVIRSAGAFALYVRARGLDSQIQAGEYVFPAHRSLHEIVDMLGSGGRPPAIWVSFPEGFTARQVAQRLQEARLASVPAVMHVVRATSLRIDGARTAGLEGYLYPETYLIPRHASAAAIARMMTREFLKRLPKDHNLARHGLGYNVPQIITVASMVEREAKADDERKLIAGVMYNRLRLGMPLQVDATIEYALPAHKTALSLHDLALNSPYNTYVHPGLPPTPIANPGAKSIAAAFHPAKTSYLYYVYKGNGHHQFSRTLQEQKAAEQRYLR